MCIFLIRATDNFSSAFSSHKLWLTFSRCKNLKETKLRVWNNCGGNTAVVSVEYLSTKWDYEITRLRNASFTFHQLAHHIFFSSLTKWMQRLKCNRIGAFSMFSTSGHVSHSTEITLLVLVNVSPERLSRRVKLSPRRTLRRVKRARSKRKRKDEKASKPSL